MSLRAVCSACNRVHNVADAFAGKAFKCKQCGAPVKVPDASRQAAAISAPQPTGAPAHMPRPVVASAPTARSAAAATPRAASAVGAPVKRPAPPRPAPAATSRPAGGPSTTPKPKTTVQYIALALNIVNALITFGLAALLFIALAVVLQGASHAHQSLNGMAMLKLIGSICFLILATASYALAAFRIFALDLWALAPAIALAALELIYFVWSLSTTLFALVAPAPAGFSSPKTPAAGLVIAAVFIAILILLLASLILSLIRCLRLRRAFARPPEIILETAAA